MRLPAGLLLLCIAGPALGGEKLSYDFRGARFDPNSFRYGGPTPDKFMKLEAEGLRLRYTGADVPPTNNPACVTWRYHVRGNFVATAGSEILQCETPTKGTFLVGPELYVMLDNANSDAFIVGRGIYRDGSAAINFKVMTKDATGKRITKDFKRLNATDKSLRGRLRLARNGSIITASFAEGDQEQFTVFQHSESGNADIRLVRFAGTAGGDAHAVLDMRILEFQLEGDALALDGPFATPLPKTDIPKAKADAPQAISEDFAPPMPEQEPVSKRNFVPLAIVLALLGFAVLVVASIVFQSFRRKAASGVANKPSGSRRLPHL